MLTPYGNSGWWCWEIIGIMNTSWLGIRRRIRCFATQSTRKPKVTSTPTPHPPSSTTPSSSSSLPKEPKKLLDPKSLPYQSKSTTSSSSTRKPSPRFIPIYGNDLDAAMRRLSKMISIEGLARKLKQRKAGTESPCHVIRRERKERERAQQRRFVQETLKQVIQERQALTTTNTTTTTIQPNKETPIIDK